MERVKIKPPKRRKPSPTGDDGRDHGGRFTTGNNFSKGNPFAARVNQLRAALFCEVTPEAMRKVVRKLLKLSMRGDVAASKVILDRTLGRIPVDILSFLASEEQSQPQPDIRFL